jgi:hypothetical protein
VRRWKATKVWPNQFPANRKIGVALRGLVRFICGDIESAESLDTYGRSDDDEWSDGFAKPPMNTINYARNTARMLGFGLPF